LYCIEYSELCKKYNNITGWETPFIDKDYQKRRYLENNIKDLLSKDDLIIAYDRKYCGLLGLFNLIILNKDKTIILMIDYDTNPLLLDNKNKVIDFCKLHYSKKTEIGIAKWITRKGWVIDILNNKAKDT